jgi:hypothetical protein
MKKVNRAFFQFNTRFYSKHQAQASTLCQVITPSLVQHQASKRRRRLLKLKARKKTAEATTGSPPLCRNMAEDSGGGGNARRPADDGDRELVQSTRWTCQGCDAKFNSSSSQGAPRRKSAPREHGGHPRQVQ